ncbi:MAG: ImmA/IrrE family metallo-endopeptidase [Deltaproteobacteria bacterium]|nr:ImmA/IrrE family metallo-endopeptidase [Deltaproteobacteria bacterium]
MLIGNRQRLGIEMVPVAPSWDLRYGPESAGWAALSIWVGGQNVCEHRREGETEVRGAFYVPLGPVADWFVRSLPALRFEERSRSFRVRPTLHESLHTWGERPPPTGLDLETWLDEREAFWSRHFLCAGAEGARLPNLAFLRQDDVAIISWEPPEFAGPPAVRMIEARGTASVGWSEFQVVLERFIATVGEWFVVTGHADVYGWLRGSAGAAGAVDLETAASLFCARSPQGIAEIMGVPVERWREAVGLGSTRQDPGESPQCQVIRDLPPRPSPDVGKEIGDVVQVASATDANARSRWRDGRLIAEDAAAAAVSSEQEGYEAARAIRAALACNGQPIADMPGLLDRFGVAHSSGRTTSLGERSIVVGIDHGRAAARVLDTPRTETVWGRRFEEARALGHLLLNPLRGGALGAASTNYAQERRRRRSGAFAAELLLPSEALEQASSEELDGILAGVRFSELLKCYGVGARTAAHHLYNRGWLSSESVREELIERYASDG